MDECRASILLQKKIIVIGGGFGGLAAAVRLAAKGHEVDLFDKRDKLGGRGYQYHVNGFKFDGGPTVITAPYIFDELFNVAGANRKDYFQFVPLDPFYRLFDHTGHSFNYRHSHDDAIKEIAKINPDDVNGFTKMVERTVEIFKLFQPYTDKSADEMKSFFNILPEVLRLGAFRGTHQFVSHYIRNSFLQKALSFHPLLLGGSPLNTPSLYTLVMQFEKEWGVHYSVGGTGQVVEGIGRLLQEVGGRIHLNSEVKRVLLKERGVNGVELSSGEKVSADIVVCNGDLAYSYMNLFPDARRRKWSDRVLARKKYSSSLVVVYFGTKKRYLDSKFHHHNIIFGREYAKLLKQIFSGKTLPQDLALYLHMPTFTDESIAPRGCESFYVLALVPNLGADIQWENVREEYKQRIYSFLQEHYLPDLQQNIIAEHMIDPLHFQSTLNSYKGAAFAMQPTLLQSAYFRPHNKSEEFENLYFVGAGTHPGAGVPAVLSSGKIVAELIDPQS